jgi:hypothetical protein
MILLPLVLLIGVACDAAKPIPCPGQAIGKFQFRGSIADGGQGCRFVRDPPAAHINFNGTVSRDPNGTEAAICPESTQAAPFKGTWSGEDIAVSLLIEGASLSECSCAVTIRQAIDGKLIRASLDGGLSGDIVSFKGTLRNRVVASNNQGSLDAGLVDGGVTIDGGTECACGLPCDVVYDLTGSR